MYKFAVVPTYFLCIHKHKKKKLRLGTETSNVGNEGEGEGEGRRLFAYLTLPYECNFLHMRNGKEQLPGTSSSTEELREAADFHKSQREEKVRDLLLQDRELYHHHLFFIMGKYMR